MSKDPAKQKGTSLWKKSIAIHTKDQKIETWDSKGVVESRRIHVSKFSRLDMGPRGCVSIVKLIRKSQNSNPSEPGELL